MGTVTQMNVRIDSDLKAEGDAALAKAGLTPSQAVRCLWQLAVDVRDRPGELAKILELRRDPDQDEERARRLAAALRGPQICTDFLRSQGIDPTEPWDCGLTDKEMLEEALYERAVERGLA